MRRGRAVTRLLIAVGVAVDCRGRQANFTLKQNSNWNLKLETQRWHFLFLAAGAEGISAFSRPTGRVLI